MCNGQIISYEGFCAGHITGHVRPAAKTYFDKLEIQARFTVPELELGIYGNHGLYYPQP